MIFREIKTIGKGDALLFLSKGGKALHGHPFFPLLPKQDREYLNRFERRSLPSENEGKTIFLPSGKKGIVLSLGADDARSSRKMIIAMRRAIAIAKSEKAKEVAVAYDDFETKDFPRAEELAEIIATQCEMANFEFVRYKTPPPGGWHFVRRVSVLTGGTGAKLAKALERGRIIGEEINKARTLSNTPGGDMTPQTLAAAAMRSGKEAGFRVKALGEKEIAKLKMGGILGVSKGSPERPRFIVMEYRGGRRGEKPTVLVGKGVTFDTGGLNLKPTSGLYEMHLDMSGGAAVIHTIAALARLKAKKNVVGLVPAVENVLSGSSYRPGDVLKTMSGKTVEVTNTDAEGRVILADGLHYAKRYKPRLVVDVATLTGASMVALDQYASAIFTTDAKLEKDLYFIGERTGDYVWPLPLWEEYAEGMKGTFSDLINAREERYGDACYAAAFLWQFIKGHSWVHLEIAPRMTAAKGESLAKGAAGAGIALLVNFLRTSA